MIFQTQFEQQRRINEYAAEFTRHLVAPAGERERRRAELVGHLTDAAEAGELTEALDRLGDPEAAAGSFAPEGSVPPAPVRRRFAAAAIDNLPLVVVTVALAIQQAIRLWSHDGTITLMFPPVLSFQSDDVCVTVAPLSCARELYPDAGSLYRIGVPLALAWSILGLGILDWRTGRTPGKRLLRLVVVSDTGLRIRPGKALLRRVSFLAGPFAWLDWIPLLWGDRRRLLDRVTATKVVSDDR